jgi:TPR repeat protein
VLSWCVFRGDMQRHRKQFANTLILATARIAAAASTLLTPPLARPQAPSQGMDPQLLARANAGDANSQYLVAFAYQNGVGVPKDLAQAAKWYRKAAEAGNRRSMEILGTLYERGLGGLPKDDVQAVNWYRKAAEAGDAFGMNSLGSTYEHGQGGLPKDDAQAADWFRKAAEAGNKFGMNSLGIMYEYGRGGLPKDDAQAVEWFRKAAEFGDASGMRNLGIMYAAGRGGLAKDDVQALSWFRKAAEAGDASGMRMLGIMYLTGQGGLTQDKAQAVSWLGQAAQRGDAIAKKALEQLEQASVGCIGRDKVNSQLTPVELYKDAASCIDQQKYDDGLFLFSLAGAYGRFDILRVKDATAHGVVGFLPGMFFNQLDKAKVAAFQDRVKQMNGNDALKAKYCSDLESMSPPGYFPTYMISHGMAAYGNAMGVALAGANPGDNPLVSPFEAAKAWKQAVDDYSQCKKPEGTGR